jgi:streptogramin lyase
MSETRGRSRRSWFRMGRTVGPLLAMMLVSFVLAAPPAQAAVKIDEFGTPSSNSGPASIAMGPDGNVWFTESSADNIGQLTPSKVPVFNYEFPDISGQPEFITGGPDGNLWFTESKYSPYNTDIGQITPSGVKTEFPMSPTSYDSYGITTGPDGNLWFSEATQGFAAAIGVMDPSGTPVADYVIDASDCGISFRITTGSDGNLWFTGGSEFETCGPPPFIGRIATSGVFTMFPAPGWVQGPWDITAGHDGNLWYTNYSTNSIGKITTSGAITEYAIPTPNSSPNGIAPSPCGSSLWFTESNPDQNNTTHVGQITTSGVITEYTVPTQGSGPEGISLGPDGNEWFVENGASQIGRVSGLPLHILCVTQLANGIFLSANVKAHQGAPVGWLMQDPGTHGIMDASGMGLFGSQDALPYGEDYSFTFIGAGTYRYDDPFNTLSTGQVRVPILVQLVPGTLDQAQVTWASAQPPPGFVFDVQVKQPDGSGWKKWMTGVTSTTAVFGPSDPLWIGAGTYSFRSRMRNSTNGAASGYSPATWIALG